jgi:hypothetical protein
MTMKKPVSKVPASKKTSKPVSNGKTSAKPLAKKAKPALKAKVTKVAA